MGHNNIIIGTSNFEMVDVLALLGHNNVVNRLMIKKLEVLGHNNSMKKLNLLRQPINKGSNNVFKNVVLIDDNDVGASTEIFEDRSDYDSEYSQYSDDEEGSFMNAQQRNNGNNSRPNENNNANNRGHQFSSYFGDAFFGSNGDQYYHTGSNNNDHRYSDDSDEEEKHYENDSDEEAKISIQSRTDIINSINSFAYEPKGNDDENCAVCLCRLEPKQQVKALSCKHVFHPKCINNWLKRKLVCPCCKKKLYKI